ncbi:hypothetical protein ACQEVZ_35240 [Dactylosporangium sp. CA-152071]|uniref:hypothetical protein n=1 Tax=Dactylosporangium sp. CA-152071 TaxID=3239933 RepID=UPI003D8FFD92
MSELGDLLAAEAKRHEPGQAPAFDEVVRKRRNRDRRHLAVVGAVVAVALGATAGPTLWGQKQQPAGAARAVVTGTLLMVGGPMPGYSRGTAGTVWFDAADGTTTSTTSAADGRFSIRLTPGRYVATGAPVNSGAPWCRADEPVVVPPEGLHDVRVLCQMR